MVEIHEDFGSPPRAWHHEAPRPANDYESSQFQDRQYSFNLDDTKLFTEPGDVITITDGKRLRRCMELLAETCSGDYQEIYDNFKDPRERTQQEKSRKDYLDKKPRGLEKARKSYIDDNEAADIIFADYQQINHPAYQLINQIKETFSPEGEHSRDIKQLWKNLTQTTAWDRYVQIYEEQIHASQLDN